MCKVALLEAVWVLTIVSAPSEVAKMVPTSDLVLVFWWFLVVEDSHFDSMVALGVTVKKLCGAKMCFFAKCGKSD